MADTRDGLNSDLDELTTLLQQTQRPNVRQILASAMDEVRNRISALPIEETKERVHKSYTAANNFAWDQTAKRINLY
jgi:hypothetical protein